MGSARHVGVAVAISLVACPGNVGRLDGWDETGSSSTDADRYSRLDVPGEWSSCSIWAEDCPPGWKCTPAWDDDGEPWSAAVCTPVVEAPNVLGEACTVMERRAPWLDTCDVHAMCWGNAGQGECLGLCLGRADRAYCADSNALCSFGSGMLALCHPRCDPLAQDCKAGQQCTGSSGGTFQCSVDVPGDTRVAGTPCKAVNDCERGLVCVGALDVPGCTGDSCCTAFCDLHEIELPCLAGQDCVPWSEREEHVLPGYERVGFCGRPG